MCKAGIYSATLKGIIMEKKVEVQSIPYGIHSIVEVMCVDYKMEIIFQGQYLATISALDAPESEIVQQILDDIKKMKANNKELRINEIAIWTEDDFGDDHLLFEMDDCESVLFNE